MLPPVRRQVKEVVMNIFRDRANIAGSLIDTDSIVQSLEQGFSGVCPPPNARCTADQVSVGCCQGGGSEQGGRHRGVIRMLPRCRAAPCLLQGSSTSCLWASTF